MAHRILLPVVLFLCLALTSDAGYSAVGDSSVVAHNARVSITLDADVSSSLFGRITSLKAGSQEVMVVDSTGSAVWSVVAAVSGGQVILSPETPCKQRALSKGNNKLTFTWIGVSVSKTSSLNVDMIVDFSDPSTPIGFTLAFYPHSNEDANDFGVWSWTINFGSLLLTESHTIFENSGFGAVHECGQSCASGSTYGGEYPQATMQFQAVYASETSGGVLNGLYTGAHDSRGEAKNFAATVNEAKNSRTLQFKVTSEVENAGSSLGARVEMKYPVVIDAFSGDWWDAAQVYRAWALKSAQWVSAGPLVKRPDVPEWLLDVNVWVNSHWQGNDIFNITGGDPAIVMDRVSNINKRFGLGKSPLALHWYEWDDLGYIHDSNYTKCSRDPPVCGFDTNYPNYFPSRIGFTDVVKNLQEREGVRIAPYINGRIYDQGIDRWQQDRASLYASKAPQGPMLNPADSDLQLYDEEYGSHAKFAVMCPATSYWQDIISSTVSSLVNDYGVDGVYIDQIAAAGPRACFDKEHGHSHGGGSYWVDGYREMILKARQGAGNDAMILTESNAEPFMDGIYMFLTLVAFGKSFSGPDRLVPAFPSIYGGYYISAGAEFFEQDFTDPDVFAAKIAKQYVFGTQMGWFSLGGRDNQNPFMGIYDKLMDSEYDSEITYLRTLSNYRSVASAWFSNGRHMREITMKSDGGGHAAGGVMLESGKHSLSTRERKDAKFMSVQFPSLNTGAWLALDESSLLVTVTWSSRTPPQSKIEFTLDMTQYGFPQSSPKDEFDIFSMEPGKPDNFVGTKLSNSLDISLSLTSREVVLLRIQPHSGRKSLRALNFV